MDRIFLDTNIMIDFLGIRKPFYKAVSKILTLAAEQKIIVVLSPISFINTNYVLIRTEDNALVLDKLRKFKVICEVCETDDLIIEKSLQSGFKDFEDAVQYFSALKSKCKAIITRDSKGFLKSEIPVMSPSEFLNSLKN
ncbi:PIN domain-containing protein [uncultured Polaribacter sp.]|uniref:type II toxin-antitoxin system VapC family toxin n=1 Tax=uncultured Polaribacter sp. TaxID=174711 RepID=UPI0026320F72|nr:PIN domain-containing protein [uncultured Polaribacter sp.]